MGKKLEALAAARREAQTSEDLESMTKAELQALADEQGVEGVDQASQTKAEMIALLRPTPPL